MLVFVYKCTFEIIILKIFSYLILIITCQHTSADAFVETCLGLLIRCHYNIVCSGIIILV